MVNHGSGNIHFVFDFLILFSGFFGGGILESSGWSEVYLGSIRSASASASGVEHQGQRKATGGGEQVQNEFVTPDGANKNERTEDTED